MWVLSRLHMLENSRGRMRVCTYVYRHGNSSAILEGAELGCISAQVL